MTAPTPVPGGSATLAGRPVARIGYGAMQLADLRGRTGPTPERAHEVLRRALELGVNHVDTAPFYGDGQADRRIREALAPYPDDLVLVSKAGARHTPQGLVPAQRPEELRASVEADLRLLGVDRLAVVNLRRVDGQPGMTVGPDQQVDLDDQLAELAALRDEGKIDGIGLSNVDLDQLNRALPVGLACVQNLYNLLERGDEALLEVCRHNAIAWVPFFPLGSAFPGQRRVTEEPAVRAAATRLGVTPSQVGLAWLLAHAPDVLLIPGTSSVDHLVENLGAGDVRLDEEALAALDDVGDPEDRDDLTAR